MGRYVVGVLFRNGDSRTGEVEGDGPVAALRAGAVRVREDEERTGAEPVSVAVAEIREHGARVFQVVLPGGSLSLEYLADMIGRASEEYLGEIEAQRKTLGRVWEILGGELGPPGSRAAARAEERKAAERRRLATPPFPATYPGRSAGA